MKRKMFQLACALFLTQLLSLPVAAQEWVEIPPEDAASHLLSKVEPVYPAFARGAGVEGVVRIRVGIGEQGRVGSIGIESGPPSLHKAATEAVLRYVYRPFEKDGHTVNAQTTVAVVFKLPNQENILHPQPPPKLPLSLGWSGATMPAAQVSPEFRKWLAANLQEQLDYFSCDDSESRSAQDVLKSKKSEFPQGIRVIELPLLPLRNADAHLYLADLRLSCLCGATGNCPMELVEVNASGIHLAASTYAWGFNVSTRQDSPYPDVFFASHVSCCEVGIAGYTKVAGEWGQLYCGKILTDGGQQETDDVQVCQ